MSKHHTFVGLDVHANTIVVAAVQGREPVRSLGIIPNTTQAIRRVLGRLGSKKDLRVCYEAGPTGQDVGTPRLLPMYPDVCYRCSRLLSRGGPIGLRCRRGSLTPSFPALTRAPWRSACGCS